MMMYEENGYHHAHGECMKKTTQIYEKNYCHIYDYAAELGIRSENEPGFP